MEYYFDILAAIIIIAVTGGAVVFIFNLINDRDTERCGGSSRVTMGFIYMYYATPYLFVNADDIGIVYSGVLSARNYAEAIVTIICLAYLLFIQNKPAYPVDADTH